MTIASAPEVVGMAAPSDSRPVLAAVGDPEHVEQLVRTAGDLALVSGGALELVSVVVKSHDSPFSVFADETIVEQFSGDSRELLDRAIEVAPAGVTVGSELIVGRSVADGLLDAIARTDARALVVGWEQRRRSDAVLGSNVDRLVGRAPCDLYVERIGHEANGVDSIMLPVAGGPHVRPAAAMAKAIAVRNDAAVSVVSVAGDGTKATDEYVEDAIDLLESVPGPPVQIETARLAADNVVDTLVESANEHDVVVFGATRRSSVRRRLVGSIPRSFVDRTDRTVILARANGGVSRTIRNRLRGLW
jgi:nucleotide-binding universal stress UspA family protein